MLLPLLLTSQLSGARAEASKGLKRAGVQGGFAGVAGNEGTFSGFGGAASFEYGLSDALTLAANATATSNQVTAKGGRSLVLSQALGVEYALDIIQYVPYFGIYAAAYELRGGGLTQTLVKPGAQIALGLDYVYSRDWTFGIETRAHVLPADLLSSPTNPTPFYTTLFLKAEYTWGWF
ncbi:MAG: hypothetical protein NVS3B20_03900 [Polyangiales bacterium]